LIAASLKGRTQYEFSFFRSRNHMTLFTMSLGIMELLVPYIFRPEHTAPLQDALLCYFEMLAAYFPRKESMFGLVDKFVCFLHQVNRKL
jgi:integrator complex subunit 1